MQWKEQQAAASEQRSLGRCCGADCWDWVKAKLARPYAVYFCTSTMTRRGSDHKGTCWRSLKRLEGDVELLSHFFAQLQQQIGWPLTTASHKSGERSEPPSHARQQNFASAAKIQGCRPFVGDPAASARNAPSTLKLPRDPQESINLLGATILL